MAILEFEEVWQLLREQLEGQLVRTLSDGSLNRVVSVQDTKIVRDTVQPDGSWRRASPVYKISFRKVWDHLARYRCYRVEKYFAAACLVSVDELRVEKVKDRPLTIKLTSTSEAEPPTDFDEEEFGDRERIVVDPDICSGKPTIRGTRIMVSNILGLLAGEYSFNRILREYPQLSRLDVMAAVAYASQVVDREKVVA